MEKELRDTTAVQGKVAGVECGAVVDAAAAATAAGVRGLAGVVWPAEGEDRTAAETDDSAAAAQSPTTACETFRLSADEIAAESVSSSLWSSSSSWR